MWVSFLFKKIVDPKIPYFSKEERFFSAICFITLSTLLAFEFLFGMTRLHAAEFRPGWQQEWEKTVPAAKAEGQVSVYVHAAYSPVLQSGALERAFHGIKLTIVSGIENDLERRFSAERRAGKFLADVFMVVVLRSYDFMQAKFLDPIKPLLVLPEVIDESKWWQGKHLYSDPDRSYLFR